MNPRNDFYMGSGNVLRILISIWSLTISERFAAESSFLDRDLGVPNFWHHDGLNQGSMYGKCIP
ncbi:hypothetical protein HAX54_003781, partial [Datura stramonium]|nr:hypothetical protein [Datura stramonium]